MNVKQAKTITGGLSTPSKMPGYAFNIPASRCIIGSILNKTKGSVCSDCYALGGRYLFSNVQDALERRFKLLHEAKDDPETWISAMSYLINRYERTKGYTHFRWHDSGDVQGGWHLDMIAEVCRRTPGVKHWLPTRELAMLGKNEDNWDSPGNLLTRISAAMIDGKPPSTKKHAISTVSTKPGTYQDAWECPAPRQGNECKDCRACWDPDVKHVDYHYHSHSKQKKVMV